MLSEKEDIFLKSDIFKSWYMYSEGAVKDMIIAIREDIDLNNIVFFDQEYGFNSTSGRILSELENQNKYGHSGCSMSMTVYSVQYIIKLGIDEFMKII